MNCKIPQNFVCKTLANTMSVCREQLPTLWEILFVIPLNIVHPFIYIMDIVKDYVQLALLLVAVHGLSKVLEYWSSFSSTVSKFTFECLVLLKVQNNFGLVQMFCVRAKKFLHIV